MAGEAGTLTSQEAARAKLVIEVQAGIIPGQPMTQYTRRWVWTSQDNEELALELSEGIGEEPPRRQAARERWIQIHGESREYAASLEVPAELNWVRRDWVWL